MKRKSSILARPSPGHALLPERGIEKQTKNISITPDMIKIVMLITLLKMTMIYPQRREERHSF